MEALIFLTAVVGLIVWYKNAKSYGRKVDAAAVSLAQQMTQVEAEMAYNEALETAFKRYILWLRKPVFSRGLAMRDVDMWLYKASACRDRVHELTGLAHGVENRDFIRSNLFSDMRNAAQEFITKADEEILRRKMSQ